MSGRLRLRSGGRDPSGGSLSTQAYGRQTLSMRLLKMLALTLIVVSALVIASSARHGSQFGGQKQSLVTLGDSGEAHELIQTKLSSSKPFRSNILKNLRKQANGDDQTGVAQKSDAVAAAANTPVDWSKVEIPEGLTFSTPRYVDPSKYITGTAGDRETWRKHITEHVKSDAYKARVQKLAQEGGRGIIINAGGPKLTTNLIITLKVLREHFKCNLPVEVAWQGSGEMDDTTWSNIKAQFGPVYGYNVDETPHPVPGLHRSGISLRRYTGKVYSLVVSRFKEVLMVDADSMFTQHPDAYFAHPQYNMTGNMFWPDAWTNLVKDGAYAMYGLNADATKNVLRTGKGSSLRDTESGQMVIDRSRHLDALEYIFYINSYAEDLKFVAWGDKDTFGLGFALAGKAHMFTQVSVPPAGLFSWRQNMLLHKANQRREAGWQLFGFLQLDSWGRPAFIHRTINKYRLDEDPWKLELVSAPMPTRWSGYYLAHDSRGPTKGVPWDFVVPDSSFSILDVVAPDPVYVKVEGSSWHNAGTAFKSQGECPAARFLSYWRMREAAVPLDRDPALESACQPFLKQLMGDQEYDRARAAGLVSNPQLRYLGHEVMLDMAYKGAVPGVANPEGAPIAAHRVDLEHPSIDGPFVQVMRAAYAAFYWVKANKDKFPVVKGSMARK